MSPATIAFNQSVVAHTPGAQSIFTVHPDGSILHVQSGLNCPADFPSTHLVDVQIYSTVADVGTDVGCDYARLTGDNVVAAKLTIFFVKASDTTTLASAFEKYRTEVIAAQPGAVPVAAALHISDQTTHADRADYRAEGYEIRAGPNHYHSELIVGIAKGWIVEVRATYPNSIIRADPDTTKQDLANQLYDIENTYVAYMYVMDLN